MSIVIVSDVLGAKIELSVRGKTIILSREELEQIIDFGSYTLDAIDAAVNQPQELYCELSRLN